MHGSLVQLLSYKYFKTSSLYFKSSNRVTIIPLFDIKVWALREELETWNFAWGLVFACNLRENSKIQTFSFGGPWGEGWKKGKIGLCSCFTFLYIDPKWVLGSWIWQKIILVGWNYLQLVFHTFFSSSLPWAKWVASKMGGRRGFAPSWPEASYHPNDALILYLLRHIHYSW